MESSPEVRARRAELEREAPIVPRSVWKRTRFGESDVIFLCGTIGAEFDAWCDKVIEVQEAAKKAF